MKAGYILLPASFLVSAPLYAISHPLGIIYLLIWVDKIVLRMVTPSIAGIELVSVSVALLGIKFGFAGAVIALIALSFVEGVRSLSIPVSSDVPPFLPSPYHAGDVIMAIIASSLSFLPLVYIVIVGIMAKFLIDFAIDVHIVGKPFDFFSAGTTLVFNVLLVIYAAGFWDMIIAL